MPLRRTELETSSVWPPRLLAACLILATALAHLVYLASPGALDLASDEAHYWDWSRHLDWSYYSKGPLVAWLIWAGCKAAGGWAQLHTGSLAFAVRLPAVLCGSLLLASLYVLTVQVFRRERLALAVVALALTLPLIAVGSSIMTIDAPYTCLWGWALVVGHRAIFRGSAWAWPVLGVLVGLGILAKYTMVLWLPFAGLFLLTSPDYRRLLVSPGFCVMTATAALCCLPILVWNWRHDWVTVRHVLGLSGMAEQRAKMGLDWLGPLTYLAGQVGLLLVFWFVVWAAALVAYRPWGEREPGVRYLWWMSAPMFAVFLVLSPKTGGGEVNWPVTAYLSGLVLASSWLGEQLQSPRPWFRRWSLVNLGLCSLAGVAVTLVMHHSTWLYPLLEPLARDSSNPYPLRRLDPTCRLRGWHVLGAEVDRVRRRVLDEEGCEPVLAGCTWNMPGELGVYCAGQPLAYSLGAALGERQSQYDLWRPNPVADGGEFQGRTFLVVNLTEALRGAFERIEEPVVVTYREHGQSISGWTIHVCHGFRGNLVPPARRYH
jgi:4-amino-4-deoxy-L-arabinose transferase-like glycosyltransferase